MVIEIPVKNHKGETVTFLVKDFISNQLLDETKRIYASNDNEAEKEIKAKNIMLPKLVIEPKITSEYLKSEECEGLLMDLLFIEINLRLGSDESRFADIKKKLEKQSD